MTGSGPSSFCAEKRPNNPGSSETCRSLVIESSANARDDARSLADACIDLSFSRPVLGPRGNLPVAGRRRSAPVESGGKPKIPCIHFASDREAIFFAYPMPSERELRRQRI